jgi:acetyl esterase/lipase
MLKKVLLWGVAIAVVLVMTFLIAAQLSPWPSALAYRYVFNLDGTSKNDGLAKHVPPGVSARLNERYHSMDRDTTFDVFYPSDISGTDRVLPTIVWIHGGGFIAGSKDHVANYLRILASKGYTTIGIDYSLAPRRIYPTPIRQANIALGHITRNAKRLHVDPARLFIAGDSAGAQIAAQLSLVISEPRYASDMGITPTIESRHLRGVILHCGFYDPPNLGLRGGIVGRFVDTALWSYFGTRKTADDPRIRQFLVTNNLKSTYPPVFISVGNADILSSQSREFAGTARRLGVSVDALFFPDSYTPPLQHEYQFNLDIEAGNMALTRTLAFLRARQN